MPFSKAISHLHRSVAFDGSVHHVFPCVNDFDELSPMPRCSLRAFQLERRSTSTVDDSDLFAADLVVVVVVVADAAAAVVVVVAMMIANSTDSYFKYLRNTINIYL